MPRRAMRCVVDLCLHAVSAPGVWLPSKEDVYISVSMFGQYRNSRLLTSVFPLLIHEKFYFEKTYYTALDPAEVADYLEDELVIIELVQLSEYTDGAVRLASYSVNVRDFLFPYPSLSPNYSSADREVLLDRTVAFPGISPKLEFASKTVIKESISPAVMALEDALEAERERRSLRSSLRSSPTRRSRSVSPSRYRSMSPCRYSTLDYYDTLASRPPFVVRKLDDDLIGRVPSGLKDGHAKSKRKKKLTYSSDDLDLGSSSLRLSKSLSRSKSALDDLDAEVAALTSTSPTYSSYRRRPRSASPVVRRSTFRERYTYPHSPTCYSVLADRVRRRLEEDRRAERMAELDASLRSYQRDRDQILKTPPLPPLQERRYTSAVSEPDLSVRTIPVQDMRYVFHDKDRDQTLRTQPLEERRYVFHDKDRDRTLRIPVLHERSYSFSDKDRDYTLGASPLREGRYPPTLDRLRLSPIRSPYYYDPYLHDLDVSTRIARTRSPESLVHVDRDHYGNERPSDNSKKTHREVFTRKVNKTYNRSYRSSSSLGPRKVLV